MSLVSSAHITTEYINGHLAAIAMHIGPVEDGTTPWAPIDNILSGAARFPDLGDYQITTFQPGGLRNSFIEIDAKAVAMGLDPLNERDCGVHFANSDENTKVLGLNNPTLTIEPGGNMFIITVEGQSVDVLVKAHLNIASEGVVNNPLETIGWHIVGVIHSITNKIMFLQPYIVCGPGAA